jgi:hypothetical protein
MKIAGPEIEIRFGHNKEGAEISLFAAEFLVAAPLLRGQGQTGHLGKADRVSKSSDFGPGWGSHQKRKRTKRTGKSENCHDANPFVE